MLLIILVEGFCTLKIKITQFPDRFHLNTLETNINKGTFNVHKLF